MSCPGITWSTYSWISVGESIGKGALMVRQDPFVSQLHVLHDALDFFAHLLDSLDRGPSCRAGASHCRVRISRNASRLGGNVLRSNGLGTDRIVRVLSAPQGMLISCRDRHPTHMPIIGVQTPPRCCPAGRSHLLSDRSARSGGLIYTFSRPALISSRMPLVARALR